MTKKPIAPILFLIAAIAVAAPALARGREPIPVPSTPTELMYDSLRDVQYCEVWLFAGTPDTGVSATYFNTSDLNNSANKMDTCPPAMWAKVSPEALKAKYYITFDYKNGPRVWTLDRLKLPVGPVEDLEGVKARWMGRGALPKGMAPPAYDPAESHRKSEMTLAWWPGSAWEGPPPEMMREELRPAGAAAPAGRLPRRPGQTRHHHHHHGAEAFRGSRSPEKGD